MAVKKTKTPQPPRGSAAIGPDIPLVEKLAIPSDLSAEDKALLEEARRLLSNVQHRMRAVMWAASELWQPAVESHQIDETASPYLSDEEFDDIANLTELFGEMSALREFGIFFQLPQPLIDSVLQDRLRSKLVPSGPAKGPLAFVSSQKKRKEQ